MPAYELRTAADAARFEATKWEDTLRTWMERASTDHIHNPPAHQQALAAAQAAVHLQAANILAAAILDGFRALVEEMENRPGAGS